MSVAVDDLYRQAYFEAGMATKGFDKTVQAEEDAGQYSKSATTLKNRLFKPLNEAISEWLIGGFSGDNLPENAQAALMMAGPDQITACLLHWLVSYPHKPEKNFTRGSKLTSQGATVGRQILDTAAFSYYLQNVETKRRVRYLAKEAGKSQSARYRLTGMLREWRNEFDEDLILRVGIAALSVVLATFPDYVVKKTVWAAANKSVSVISKTEAWWELYEETVDRFAMASPLLLPTIIPPKAWATTKDSMAASQGGYYFLRRPMIRNMAKSSQHLVRLSTTTVDALNHAQATPWVINQGILSTLKGAQAQGISLPCVPSLSDAASEEEVGVYSEFQRTLGAAESLNSQETLWFPKSYDWRLRMYDLPNDLRPQGSDLARGLLRFKEAEEMTPDGLYWLQVHLGNLLGKDKAVYADRVQAVNDNHDLIQRVAEDPLKNREWTEAEDPWQFLAACQEYVKVCSSDGRVSTLPVSLDGSCSGMQHFSMLTRDYKGALATNCTSSAEVQDLYLSVATRVQARVELDASQGDALALLWWAKISDRAAARKVCKRAVMTVPYGVTDRGIAKFMLADKHVSGFPKDDQWKAASYMTRLIRAALDDTMSNARAVQAYINAAAYDLALRGKPLVWDTPAGSTVVQGYKNLVQKRISTAEGRLIILKEEAGAPYDSNRARMASSPNVIHSLDGAHLQLTVKGLKDRGINSIFLVHDSFGAHPKHVPVMRDVLRDGLYDIYQHNQLERWRESVEAHSGVRLQQPPELGDWDVSEVRQAEYLFA